MERAWPVRLFGSYAHSQAGRPPFGGHDVHLVSRHVGENATSSGFWTSAFRVRWTRSQRVVADAGSW